MSIEQNKNSSEAGKQRRAIPSAEMETHSQVSADQSTGVDFNETEWQFLAAKDNQ